MDAFEPFEDEGERLEGPIKGSTLAIIAYRNHVSSSQETNSADRLSTAKLSECHGMCLANKAIIYSFISP